MAKYRIVKMAGYEHSYKVQQKFWKLFWATIYSFLSLEEAENYIRTEIRQDKIRQENKKDIVIKEY
jgi:hypothetical protein